MKLPQDYWINRRLCFAITFIGATAALIGCAGCVYSATSGTISPQRLVREEEKVTTDKTGTVTTEKRRTEVTGLGYSGANPKDFSTQGEKVESPDFAVSFGGVKVVGYDPSGIITGTAAIRYAYFIGAGFILIAILVGWLSGKWLLGVLLAVAGFGIMGAAHFNTQYPWVLGAGAAVVVGALLIVGGVALYELYRAKKQGVTLQTIVTAVEKTSDEVQDAVKKKIGDVADTKGVAKTVKDTVSKIKNS